MEYGTNCEIYINIQQDIMSYIQSVPYLGDRRIWNSTEQDTKLPRRWIVIASIASWTKKTFEKRMLLDVFNDD